jgi:hypothetical protein
MIQPGDNPENLKQAAQAVCRNHPQVTPAFICTACGTAYCNVCAKRIGSTAAICLDCGSLCVPFRDFKEKAFLRADQSSKFGVSDFLFALRYPLQQATTVFVCSLIYGISIFFLPYFALPDAGALLGTIGLIPGFLGQALMFGCASQIIRHLETGQKDSHGVFDITDLLVDIEETVLLTLAILIAVGWPLPIFSKIGLARPALFWVSAVWAVVYYPLALMLASLTKRFWLVLNPLAALSLMHKMGGLYWKLYVMCLGVWAAAASWAAVFLLSVLRYTFHPLIVLILVLIVGPPIFYANMVTAALIGRALFKVGDKIKD